jgi:two-component system nitrogen regulation response regulator GlnG
MGPEHEHPPTSRLLVVDDAPPIHALFAEFFDGPAYSLAFAATAAAARDAFASCRPDVVVLDVRLPDRSGLDLFGELRALDPAVPVIIITAMNSSATAIEAMKRGAYDYLVKPLHIGQVRALIGRALQMRRLMSVPVALGEAADGGSDVLIGQSPAMQEVYKAIGRVAPKDVTVLITGETGTGKELVARAIYQHSHRAAGLFLAINCAAIPETLLESELFGHEKGAFTGADRQRVGLFEQCSGSTMFLDEVGEMPRALQSKLLRVLQEQQLYRVGGDRPIPIDVRVLAATNRDLEAAVAQGHFRADLYYRLNVFTISLPPLRERPEDLPRLVEHLLCRLAAGLGQPARQLAPDALEALTRHPWPGNVRELQSVLKQAILQSTGAVVMLESLPRALREAGGPPAGAGSGAAPDWARFVSEGITQPRPDLHARALELVERTLIPLVLRHTLGNQTAAAELLGITRGSLRYKIRALGIDVEHAARTGEDRPRPGATPRGSNGLKSAGASADLFRPEPG